MTTENLHSKIKIYLPELISLRHHLHQEPEQAHNEHKTAKRIAEWLGQYTPDSLIQGLGGTGVAAVFKGKEPGPTLLIRCELDGLPIPEENTIPYVSMNQGSSHTCGHDGHMVMVSGLAPLYSAGNLTKGTIILFYQPAEETGTGAKQVLEDPDFHGLNPDFVLALHNLPGYPLGSIIIRENTFAAASKGMIISLKGRTSHAGEPERGISPVPAVGTIIQTVTQLSNQAVPFNDFVLATIVHINVGEAAFGITPGIAKVLITLRSYLNDDMELLSEFLENHCKEQATSNRLHAEISWTEEFLATINNQNVTRAIRTAATQHAYPLIEASVPFRWSEDFSYFTEKIPGALFGLGSGEEQPQLHNPNFNFPDEIIINGIATFYQTAANLGIK